MLALKKLTTRSYGAIRGLDIEEVDAAIVAVETVDRRPVNQQHVNQPPVASPPAPTGTCLGKRKREEAHDPDINVRKHAPHQEIKLFECRACAEKNDADGSYTAPCEHNYCDDCLKGLFSLSMKDETVYPPRCCRQPIPYDDVRLFLGAELARDFDAKREELDDQARLYCHVPTCSAYIRGADRNGALGTCFHCYATTCVTCKVSAWVSP